MKSTNHVLAKGVVDTGFTTNRRIYLGKQSCWNLDEWNTTLIAGCGKTGHITNDSSTKSNQSGFPGMPLLKQTIEDHIKGLPVLELLAIGKHDGIDPLPGETGFRLIKIERFNRLVGNNHDLCAGDIG